jgi:hypothetical protein
MNFFAFWTDVTFRGGNFLSLNKQSLNKIFGSSVSEKDGFLATYKVKIFGYLCVCVRARMCERACK